MLDTSDPQQRARDLLRALSWRVEKLFRQQGQLGAYIWLTEDMQGRRCWFETAASPPDGIDDATALAALRAEMRADFVDDQIKCYGVAFPAYATTVMRQSILHLTGQEVKHSVVCLEVHDAPADVHLVAQRDIIDGRLGALAAIEEAQGCFAL
jgi:hypothetical protein